MHIIFFRLFALTDTKYNVQIYSIDVTLRIKKSNLKYMYVNSKLGWSVFVVMAERRHVIYHYSKHLSCHPLERPSSYMAILASNYRIYCSISIYMQILLILRSLMLRIYGQLNTIMLWIYIYPGTCEICPGIILICLGALGHHDYESPVGYFDSFITV